MCCRKEISNKPVIRRVNSIVFQSKCNFVFRDHFEVVSFLKINFKRQEIEGIYFDEILKNFVVKVTNSIAFDNCVGNTYNYTDNNGSLIELIADKADDFVHCVKLFNVPCEISNDMILEVIGKFGKVHEIRSDTVGKGEWKIPNGNKIVHMEVNGKLPVSLEIAGVRLKVFSASFTKICFSCGGKNHLINSCMKGKSEEEGDEENHSSAEFIESQLDKSDKKSILDYNSVGDIQTYSHKTTADEVTQVVKKSENSRVLMIERTEPDLSMKTVSDYVLNKCIKHIIGSEPKRIKRLRSGNVLVETKDYRQADSLINCTALKMGINVKVYEQSEKKG